MYDINLFERLKPKPKKTNYAGLLIFLVVVLFISFIAFNEVRYRLKKAELQEDIYQLIEYNTSSEIQSKVKDVDKKILLNQELTSAIDRLSFIDQLMNVNNVVQEGILTSISTSVPEHCFLSSIKIESDKLFLSGYADSYESVADFQHKLRSTGKMITLFNPSISEEDANYSFSIAAQVWRNLEDED